MLNSIASGSVSSSRDPSGRLNARRKDRDYVICHPVNYFGKQPARILGRKNNLGGAKRESRKRGKVVEPGGFPEGVAAVVTHPGLLEASEEPSEVRTGVMKGNLILERIGIDR